MTNGRKAMKEYELTEFDVSDIIKRFNESGEIPSNAQAMALVKKFPLDCSQAIADWADDWITDSNADLNRAIVECVAKIQEDKP